MPGSTDEGKAPEGIICQLSKRVARDPVRTPYGHVSGREILQPVVPFPVRVGTPSVRITFGGRLCSIGTILRQKLRLLGRTFLDNVAVDLLRCGNVG